MSFDRTMDPDPHPAPPDRRPDRMREGHYRERDARRHRESLSFREHSDGVLTDIGFFGCVLVGDPAEGHFGGYPYTTRRAVAERSREGFVKESLARRREGNPLKVLTLTRPGAHAVRDLALEHGLDPEQQIGSVRRPRAQLPHDTAIDRACERERRRWVREGATIRCIRFDADLRGTVAHRSGSARLRDGQRAGSERRCPARALELPSETHGRVLCPHARIVQSVINRGAG